MQLKQKNPLGWWRTSSSSSSSWFIFTNFLFQSLIRSLLQVFPTEIFRPRNHSLGSSCENIPRSRDFFGSSGLGDGRTPAIWWIKWFSSQKVPETLQILVFCSTTTTTITTTSNNNNNNNNNTNHLWLTSFATDCSLQLTPSSNSWYAISSPYFHQEQFHPTSWPCDT